MMLWQSGGKPIENDRNRIRQLELRLIKMIAHAVVKVAAGHSQVVKVPLKAQGRIALSGGAWRKATLIVVARDKNGNGGTLGRNIVLHGILPK